MARNQRHLREMFHVPAERLDYYYMLREDMPDPLEGVIGYVLNDTCEGLRIILEVDPEYIAERNAWHPLLYVDPESYLTECRIVLNVRMAEKLIKGDPEVQFELWNQVAHFVGMEDHLQEFMTYEMGNTGGYTTEQYIAILDKQVLPYQAAADDFSYEYMGKVDSIIALNGMIAQCKKNPKTMNDRGLIMELLNRKNRISAKEEVDG